MHSDTQVQSHRQMPVQLGVSQAYMYQGTREECYSGQIPFDFHHGSDGTHHVNNMTVYPPHGGEVNSFLSGYSVR
jgi:hypothetical protein